MTQTLLPASGLTGQTSRQAPAVGPDARTFSPIRRNGRVFKLCGFCNRFVDWRGADVRFVGHMQTDDERLELKSHRECGSTGAVVVARVET